MSTIKEILAKKIPPMRKEIKDILTEHGDKVISQVTVAQAYGGMRGVKSMICDTSVVDPDKGVAIRGRPISELTDKLPEEMFFLLCTGELPDAETLQTLQDDLRRRAEVPPYVWRYSTIFPKTRIPWRCSMRPF